MLIMPWENIIINVQEFMLKWQKESQIIAQVLLYSNRVEPKLVSM